MCWNSAPPPSQTTSATGWFELGINLATGALPDAVLSAIAPVVDEPPFDSDVHQDADKSPTPADVDLPADWDRPKFLSLVARALPSRLHGVVDPFVKGLRRRLDRDRDRLHMYHNDLHREAMCRAAALPGEDPKRRRELQRAEAIAVEYRAKLDDLARQYATRVTVEWVQTLDLATQSTSFHGADTSAQGRPGNPAGLEPVGASAGAAGVRVHSLDPPAALGLR